MSGSSWAKSGTAPRVASPPPLSTAYGGGGLFGIAYGLGVVNALRDAGAPLSSCPSIGTSAGSWVAACTALDVGFDELCRLPQVSVPDVRRGALRRLGCAVFGDRRSALVTATAVRAGSGRRVLLSGSDHDLADMVAASSAVPLLFAPVRAAGMILMDGGVRSLVHADLAASARRLLVVAPIAGAVLGRTGRALEVLLRREVRHWQQINGGQAHLVRPNRRIAALVRHPLALFDKELAVRVYPMAYEHTTGLLDDLGSICDLRLPRAA